ncbi:MAG: molybdate ABC transporter substrate-binding protein [Gammaproteobacteria bacterium RIFCSPLOWO2_02_FULL_61_13]|nr:MAG: molybdate ABC transporter substrate-binding protein [Gammaproteobacteria bacterium RIFCSPLOWO2_02_FULL_61_13]
MRFLVALAIVFCSCLAAATEPLVAVAANLAPPVKTLAEDFARESGTRVRINVGSSGDLLRQILHGARYEIYIAADADYTARAQAEKLTVGEPALLGLANLGAFIPRKSTLAAATDLATLGRMLSAGNYRRIAMANPDVAPFGTAAQQSLRRMGVWAAERDRVIMGENLAQTVQFTLAGGVDAGFISESYALLPEVAAQGRFLPIPGDWHDPLAQTMVLLNGAGDGARAFFTYLRSDAAQELLSRSGYTVPAP